MSGCPSCGWRVKRLDSEKRGDETTRIYQCLNKACGASWEVQVIERVRPAPKRYLRGNSIYRETATA